MNDIIKAIYLNEYSSQRKVGLYQLYDICKSSRNTFKSRCGVGASTMQQKWLCSMYEFLDKYKKDLHE